MSRSISADYAIEVIDKEYRRGRLEAIEECALVADERADKEEDEVARMALYSAAAAIRTLKDKP